MDRLNLGFMQPRHGLRPILMFPDSRREEKKWSGFAQLSSDARRWLAEEQGCCNYRRC